MRKNRYLIIISNQADDYIERFYNVCWDKSAIANNDNVFKQFTRNNANILVDRQHLYNGVLQLNASPNYMIT